VLHLIGRETSRSSRVAPPGDREGQTLAAAPSVLPPLSPSSSPPEVLPTEGRGIDERGGGDLALGCSPWLLARPHGRKAAVLGWLGQRPLPGGALRPRRVSPLVGDSGSRSSVRGGRWLSRSGGLAAVAFGAGGAAGGVLGGGPGCRSGGSGWWQRCHLLRGERWP
jgi:hypothetical protein